MANIKIGGDPESYMDAPTLSVGGGSGGGGSFIANVLDALGIHKQVAKEPKQGKAKNSESPTGTTQSVPPMALPVLNDAEAAFTPSVALPTDWGKRYLDSIKPIQTIDPNSAL